MTFLRGLRPHTLSCATNKNYRVDELFRTQLETIRKHTDRLFFYLPLVEYPAAILVALLWSPLAWAGSRSSIHFHVWLAVVFGGLLVSLPLYLIRTNPGAPLTRHVVGIAQMLFGSLLIHLSGGRIETHFHIFGSLAFLAFYQDVSVLATATAVVATDHFARGLLLPQSIYGIDRTSTWRFIEHACWVFFEDTFLLLACFQSKRQMLAVAGHQAQLEQVNETIEVAVRERTQELSKKTVELAAARDAAMESTRLKGEFLANVSHEIRTPMNGVLGMTGILLETVLSEDQRECAMTVQRSAEGLLTIINDILDFSKIEAGKLVLECVDFPLWNEVEDVIGLLTEAAGRKRLELISEIDDEVPFLVAGDAGRLRQILLNLAGNAVKFTEKGEVVIHVKELQRSDGRSRLRFEVSDTGMGIPEQAQKRLFQAFVQVDGTTTRKHEGTGLGLAIAKHLVELMGGDIGLDSLAGRGSTFWFEIPLEVLAEKPERDMVQRAALRGLRALIVDDNATNREVMRRTTAAWGMTCEVASEGPMALQMLEETSNGTERFDIALLDCQMPGMDGIELAAAIQARPHLRSIRLVMLTSLGQRALCTTLLEAGIAACMTKPFRRQHLYLTIARMFGRLPLEVKGSLPKGKQVGLSPAQSSLPFDTNTLHLLVAEDNAVNQRVLASMLDRLGHTYKIVGDGAEAVEAVRQSSYHAILMDCQMPNLDGFKATAAIRGLPEPISQIPIVAVTANAMNGDRERCLQAGMSDYLTKPIRLERLMDVLASVLPDRQLSEENADNLPCIGSNCSPEAKGQFV